MEGGVPAASRNRAAAAATLTAPLVARSYSHVEQSRARSARTGTMGGRAGMSSPSAPSSSLRPTSTTFVGREAELARLTTAFATATSGQGQLVLVSGEPGIGKSALCERLAGVVTAEAGCVLLGRCDDAGALSVP